MLQTKNDLSELDRSHLVELLNQRLADTLDLVYHAKQAHWNVRGPHFRSLHKLFDVIAEGILEGVDLMAERLVQLGGIAQGTLQAVVQRTSLSPYPLQIIHEKNHLEALSSSLAQCAKSMRQSIDHAQDWNDQDTADLLVQLSQSLDKFLWMVESHLFEREEERQEQTQDPKLRAGLESRLFHSDLSSGASSEGKKTS
ncbi:MAG: DNA starvation/stationary phase protection protein Dps [Bdellovibrionia bacterium]